MNSISSMLASVKTDFKALARVLSFVENDHPEAQALLKAIDIDYRVTVIGITGPPGAGKSTLINVLTARLTALNKRVAILAVDPTSPFNKGSLLGDRIRMTAHFSSDQVFIRSVATRGSLGGLSARSIEMTDVLRAAAFDVIFVETVGIGQSEVEIAGLADITLLVLVPGYGDEIQNIKSGVMEIADAFVVNKADRLDADATVHSLKKLVHQKEALIPVFKTFAESGEGVDELLEYLIEPAHHTNQEKSSHLMAEKAYRLIANCRMADLSKGGLSDDIAHAMRLPDFNLYRFIENY